MENIKLNTEYIKINSTTGETFIPIEINNNIVRFNNNAQCAVDIFNKTFIEKNASNPQTQETQEIVTEKVTQPTLDNDEYLANIFNNYSSTLNAINNAADIPLSPAPPVNNQMIENATLDSTQLTPESSIPVGYKSQNILESKYGNGPTPVFNDDDYDDNDDVYMNRQSRVLNGRGNVKKQINDFQLIDEYEKVQLSKKPVKLNIDVEMFLPDPLHIQVIRDMYRGSSNPDYVEYMVNKFIHEFIMKNNETFKTIMMSEISRWLKQFNKKTKIIKKPILGRSEVVKTTKKEVVVESESDKPEEIKNKTKKQNVNNKRKIS